MSGTQVSGFADPNILYKSLSGLGTAEVQRNQLLNQQTQQAVTDHDIAAVGQAAAPLLGMSEDDAAKAYPGWLQDMQSRGLAKYAPATYPGHAATQALVQRAMPLADQFKTGYITPPGTQAAIDAALRPGGAGSTGATTGGGDGTAATTGGTPANAGALRDQLVSTLGVSPVDAGAILSNFHAESGLNAGINEIHPAIPGSRGGYGLAQWTGPRRDALEAFAQQNKLDVSQSATQLAFMKQELQQPEYAGVLKAMQAAQTPEEKAAIFFHGYLSGNAPSLEHNLPGHVARAGAYAGLPAATVAATQPQGPPGAPTAPAVMTGDVARPGDVPPPPGGAPGAYGGGGFGAVVGRPATTVGTNPIPAGRPTGPPVITDRPAGSAVVAGPPGTAVVGQSVPPSPAVAGNVAAINAGIVARGGQPVTDPNLTPTPARYAGTAPAPSVEAAPQPGWGTQVGSGYGPQNALAPTLPPAPPAAQPVAAAPAAAQPQPPPPGARANLPRAADVPTGVNSQQYRDAADLQRRALILEAQVDPTGRLKQLATGLRQQAQLLLQTDSVVQTQEGQLHPLTGKVDETAKPLADYHETSPGSGIWVGGPGTEPKFQPPGRLIIDKAGDVWRTTTGGAEKLSRLDPAAVAALNEAAAAGTATGTATAKQLPDLMATARNAAAQEGQIDYAANQLREAAKGGVPSGYFSPALATAAAAAKSLGLDGALRAVGVNPEAVGNVQTAQKTLSVIGGAILRQALGPGSAITDGKIEAFIHTQPGIETDPQALQRIMAWARSQYTYERELGHAAVSEAAKPENAGRLPPHWLPAYYRDHGFAPIYDPGTQEMKQPDGTQPARETPPAQPSQAAQPAVALPPAAVSRLKDGVVTTFTNGQQWTLRNGQPVQVR